MSAYGKFCLHSNVHVVVTSQNWLSEKWFDFHALYYFCLRKYPKCRVMIMFCCPVRALRVVCTTTSVLNYVKAYSHWPGQTPRMLEYISRFRCRWLWMDLDTEIGYQLLNRLSPIKNCMHRCNWELWLLYRHWSLLGWTVLTVHIYSHQRWHPGWQQTVWIKFRCHHLIAYQLMMYNAIWSKPVSLCMDS